VGVRRGPRAATPSIDLGQIAGSFTSHSDELPSARRRSDGRVLLGMGANRASRATGAASSAEQIGERAASCLGSLGVGTGAGEAR
jgi:hypothetical protein